MRNHVTFKCTKFNLTERHENFINPDNFGEDLANWLTLLLDKEANIESFDPGQEDWGWYIPLKHKEKTFYINLGFYPNEDTDWLLWVEPPSRSIIEKFKKINYNNETIFVCNSVNSILQSENTISEVHWHLEKDFKVGNESEWKPEPNHA